MEPIGEHDHNSYNEESPLLIDTGSSCTHPVVQQDDGVATRSSGLTRRSVFFCAALITTSAVVEMIFLFQMLATNQILEDIICDHIETGGPDGRLDCGNNEAVQSEIALLRGWQTTFDFIPGKRKATFLILLLSSYEAPDYYTRSLFNPSEVPILMGLEWQQEFSLQSPTA